MFYLGDVPIFVRFYYYCFEFYSLTEASLCPLLVCRTFDRSEREICEQRHELQPAVCFPPGKYRQQSAIRVIDGGILEN